MGQRMFNTDFWNDPWVVDNLNPLDSHLFIYLFTNARSNVAGVYEISLKQISREIGIEQEQLASMMKRLEPKVVYKDSWVILRNTIKNQNYHSPKMKVAIDTILKRVPQELIQHVKWPDDYGTEKPKGSSQTSLLDNKNDDNVAQSSMKQHDDLSTTETGVGYGIDTVSHSNSNSNYNNNNNRRPIGLQAKAVDDQPPKPPKVRKQEIDDMLEYWHETVGYKIESRVKQNRFAVSNLLKKHGQAKLKRLVGGVAMAKKDRFAPSINDFSQMQSKFNDFIAWGHKQQMIANDNESTVIS